MSKHYFRAGEMAPLADKVDGNENPAKVTPYEIKISYDSNGEFSTRVTWQRHDYFFRALTVPALKDAVRQAFRGLRFSYTLSRSAELATNPHAILKG
jgi:hypothetical protein